MSTVNLPSYIEDPNYRYTMPKVRCKVEGSGNGIKTNVINTKEICSALKRNPEYLTKWFGCELCVQARYFGDEGKAILQGVHVEEALIKAIDRFIEKYVLCPKCSLPEVDMRIAGKKSIAGKCNACGHDAPMDALHRVAATIFKNPPEGLATVGGLKEKKLKVKASSEKKTKVRTKVKKAVDGEEADVKKKVKVKKIKTFKVNSSHADKCTMMLAVQSFENIEEGQRASVDVYSQHIRAVQIAEGFGPKEKVHICIGSFLLPLKEVREFAALDDEEDEEKSSFPVIVKIDLVKEFLKDIMPYIQDLMSSSAVKRSDLIAGFQSAIFKYTTIDSIGKVLPLLVKELYDEDILDSPDILDYYNAEESKGDLGFNEVKSSLTPLLKWLADNENKTDDYEDYSENYSDEPTDYKVLK